MAGAITTVALGKALNTQLDLSNPAAWIPPIPDSEVFGSLAAVSLDLAAAAAAQGDAATEPPPPLPPIVPPTVNVVTENAFGLDPFDANGCPILSPTDLTALATLPFRDFAAIETPTTELPPLPEGFDVMPLAQASGIFVESEDFFRFRAISTNNSVPVSFFGRVQRPSGYIIPFNHTLTTSTANTTFTTTPVPGKGILLGCAASVPIGSITAGAVNAVGEIGRVQGGTFTPHTLLFSGQLDDLYPLTLDGGGIPTSTGRPTILTVSNAGGTVGFKTVVITPSAGKRIRFIHVRILNTSTAAAGERTHFCILQVGGSSRFRAYGNMGQGPSSAVESGFTVGANGGQVCPAQLSSGIPIGGTLPPDLYFYEAVTVLTGTTSGVDTVSQSDISYEES